MYENPFIGEWRCARRREYAFALIELLVVIAVASMLISILLPALNKARTHAKKTLCISNLHDISLSIHSYAMDYDDTIPFGPEPGSFFYPVKGNVTSLISLGNGNPVGLGLMLDGYLSDQPKVLFCPGADQPSKAEEQLARVGHWEAQCDYYYRHASVILLSGTPDFSHIRLSRLGKNRNGRLISSLVMDVQFLANPSLESWGVFSRTSHRRKTVNVLHSDGGVVSEENYQDRFTVNIIGSDPTDSLDKILRAFELADESR